MLKNPYIQLARLDRPIGIWLLMLPCWWGIAFVSPALPPLKELILFALGAIIMRSAGCTLNDILDRKFDALVDRTKNRPIANGTIPVIHALMFFIGQCFLGLLILLILPPQSQIACLGGFLLLLIYPLMKRITHWPQLVLGFAFNSGIVISALSLQSHDILNWKALSCLYGAGILWTIAYDTIYAFQDIRDDLKIGVRSTAIISRTHPHLFIGLFYGISLLLLGLCGYFSGLDIWFYISLLSVAGAMAKILRQFSPTDPKACLTCFKSNQWIGWLIFLSLVKV